MQEVFEYTYGETTLYADALKVRRLLLANTDGRAWAYIRDQARIKEEQRKILEDPGLSDDQREAALAVRRTDLANLEGILAEAAIRAFGFEPVNPETGEGCSEFTALTLLSLFMEFAAGKE